MAQIIWSGRAKANLRKIYNFYAGKNLNSADKIISGIVFTAEQLQINILYQREENLLAEHRRVIFKHFKIIYKISDKNILILQIFDSRQNPEKLKP